MHFTVNSSQSSPIRLILSASVKQTAERGPEIKRWKGGKEDTEVNNGGGTEGRRSDESRLDCVAAFMIAPTVRGTVTDAGPRGCVGYTGTRTFVVPSIETYLFSKHTHTVCAVIPTGWCQHLEISGSFDCCWIHELRKAVLTSHLCSEI